MTLFHSTVAWNVKELEQEKRNELEDYLTPIFGNHVTIAKTFEGYICASFTFASFTISSAMLKSHNVCDVAGDLIEARIHSLSVQIDDTRQARPI